MDSLSREPPNLYSVTWTRRGTEDSLGRRAPRAPGTMSRSCLDPDGCLVRIPDPAHQLKRPRMVHRETEDDNTTDPRPTAELNALLRRGLSLDTEPSNGCPLSFRRATPCVSGHVHRLATIREETGGLARLLRTSNGVLCWSLLRCAPCEALNESRRQSARRGPTGCRGPGGRSSREPRRGRRRDPRRPRGLPRRVPGPR